jgi:hypothetical protein
VDWGILNGPTLANMHLAQGHLDEQIQVEGQLSMEEREEAILDAASLKLEVIERILPKDWNIKRPTWHGGDILGNECRKLMALTRLIFDQIKAYLVEQLVEDGGSERAKREVRKRCDIVAKALLLFDGFLSLLRTDRNDLTMLKSLRRHKNMQEKAWQYGGYWSYW